MGAPRPGLRAQRVMLYSLTGHVLSSLRAYWDLHPAAGGRSSIRGHGTDRLRAVPGGQVVTAEVSVRPQGVQERRALRGATPGVAVRCDGSSEVWSSELSHSTSARSHRAPD